MKTKQLNKVRDMVGRCPGNGSAGRAGVCHVKRYRKLPEADRSPGFGDVGRACERWLMEHDEEWRLNRERRVEADFLRHARRLADAERAEKEFQEETGGGR